jgi:methylglutaconyl-CoA hydratase/polyketide biosynthesis enoyl-CoA hydratase PksH
VRVGCDDTSGPSWRLTLTPDDGGDIAISSPGLERLLELLEAAEHCEHCRMLVLQGSGGSFCRGMDLEAVVAAEPADARRGAELYADCLVALRAHSKYLVAAVDGAAFGGGVGIAAAADVVVATRKSVFGLPELMLGLLPAMVLPLLLERMPPQKARALALTLEGVDADRAHQLGLVDELVADAAALERAVRRLGRASLRAEPGAVAALKRLCTRLPEIGWREGIAAGCELTSARLVDGEITAVIRAYLDGQPLPWHARPPGGSAGSAGPDGGNDG